MFAVTILTAEQKELSDRFAGKLPNIIDRFEGVQTENFSLDAPVFKDGMAYFHCRVVNSMPVGENTLFVAEVIAVRRAKASEASRWCIITGSIGS